MYLDRTYRPRRRRKSKWRFWPVLLLAVIAILLYEHQPTWLLTQPLQPTPTPTRSAVSYLAEAESLLRRAEYGGALAAYAAVARLEPQNPEPLIVQSELQLALQNVDAARRLAEQAVEIAPEHADTLAALARALDWQGEYEAAAQYAFDGLEIAPDNANVLAVLGEIYTDIRNFPVAEGYLQDAYELAPEHPLVLRNLAYYQEAQGNYEEAIALYNRAVEQAPHRFDLYIEMGRQYSIGLLDYEAANESYRRAVEVYESAITLDALGFGLYNVGDNFQAVRVLRDAVELDPEYGPAQVHLGMVYYALRNYEDAVPALQKGVDLLGDAARIEHYYSLGLAYIYKEPRECQKAMPWLQMALEIEPDSGPALDGLARCRTF